MTAAVAMRVGLFCFPLALMDADTGEEGKLPSNYKVVGAGGSDVYIDNFLSALR